MPLKSALTYSKKLDHSSLYNDGGGRANLSSDDIDGKDHMNVEDVARTFASSLASKTLKPPYVLGILGSKWGSGKSFFFNLIKKHLIQIQKEGGSVIPSQQRSPYMGHMYCITFDSWT